MDNTCRTCCRPLAAPFRVWDERGKILNGCVDSDHDGYLVPLSASINWHNRPEAKRIRKALNGYRNGRGKA